MASAWAKGSVAETFFGRPTDAAGDRYAAFADTADAYVATTLEAIGRIDAATHGAADDPVRARRLAEIRARLDGLDDLIVTLRELQAKAAAG